MAFAARGTSLGGAGAAPLRHPHTLIVGLTGGIAVGKTTVARQLADRGADWIDADTIAREIVAPQSALLAAVAAEFGADILDEAGALRRKALGAIVFGDVVARRRLEALLHPAIIERIAARIEAAAASQRAIVLVDAALLVEMGLDRAVDRVVVVVAPLAARIGRVATRDGLDEAAAHARIAAQAADDILRARADWVIDNSGSLAKLQSDVDLLWRELLAVSGPSRGGSGG